MSKNGTTSQSGKRKQEKTSASNKDAQSAAGGELHQIAGGEHPALTTNQGVPLSDNQNSLRANPRGPTLLEDFILREKIMHFDHERIPERIVHARGTGVHGFFELTASLKQYTTARILTEVGEKTPVFARFSTVAGGAGSVDTPRDVRGFAVKFYTKEGNWDLVGNNIPVFFIQDAIKFPDLIHAVKMEPDRGFPQSATAHDTFWDFISLTPESMHMVMWIMSDRTIPRSLRMIEGFGVHSFRLINEAGESTFVKFHWRPKLGLQSTVWDETVKIAGADPDFHRRDMFEAIDGGQFPRVGIRGSALHAGGGGQVPVRSPGRDQADPRRTGAPEGDRPHGARPLAGQFLRRNRAGRLLPGQHRTGHRFLERSAAAGPPVLLSRHAAFAPGLGQFPPDPDQCAQVPVRQPAARRAHADGAAGGPCCVRAQLPVRNLAAGNARHGLSQRGGDRNGRERPHPGRKLRRPLQPGAAVLSQPDRVRAGAHRLGVGVRAFEGRPPARA